MDESKENQKFVWTCVISYFAIWLLVMSNGFEWPQLVPALVLASTYAGMHYYEMVVRGRCALSADSTAIPVTLLVTALGVLAAYFAGVPIYSFLMSLPIAWIAGHVVLFSLIFVLSKIGVEGFK